MLPTVNLGGYSITRLIIGGNPFSGNSHQSAEMNAEMEDFFTTAKVKETLFRCMECGINTMQLRADKHICRIIREFRLDGGNLHWVAQTASEFGDFEAHVRRTAQYNPIGIYLHGTQTDSLFKQREYAEIERRLRVIRKSGKLTGLGTHMPDVIYYAEEHGWDVDFYMACVYNLSKVDRVSSEVTGIANTGEPFDDADRPLMYAAIRSTAKPCLAFKILGAGRRCASTDSVRQAYEEAFANIKPVDAIVVGMFPKAKDQVGENASLVRQILAG